MTIDAKCRCWNPAREHDKDCKAERAEKHDGQHDPELCVECRVAVGMGEDQD